MSFSVYVTRRIPESGIQMLHQAGYNVDIFAEDRVMSKQEIIGAVKGKDAVLCLLTDPIDEEVLRAADSAKIFANYAVGYNNIDIKTAARLGIQISNTPGVLTEATADLTWALLCAAARRIPESDRFTRQGNFKGWAPLLLLGGDIYGQTLGIIGAGRIGCAVSRRAAGFQMRILYAARRSNPDLEEQTGAQWTGLDALLEQSDFVSIHTPLTPETRHLISEKQFEKMKKTAYLINTSRGPIVDESALVNALKKGEIAGAGLDVFEQEPQIHPELLKLDNAVLAPHIGSATIQARNQMSVMAARNIIAVLEGDTAPNLVNTAVLG